MADFDAFTSADPTSNEVDPAAEFLAREQDQFAALEADNAFPETDEGGDSGLNLGQQEPEVVEDSSPYAAISQADREVHEPEKIKRWREEQAVRLEEKDVESEKKAEQWRQAATKELEDWYKHREEQYEKNQSNNRESEAEFIKLRDEVIPGQDWERVCRVCEFNPKVNKTTKDVSRMRGILLQLKQNPLVKSN